MLNMLYQEYRQLITKQHHYTTLRIQKINLTKNQSAIHPKQVLEISETNKTTHTSSHCS